MGEGPRHRRAHRAAQGRRHVAAAAPRRRQRRRTPARSGCCAIAEPGDRYDRALWTATAEATGGAGNSNALVGTPETVAAALLDYSTSASTSCRRAATTCSTTPSSSAEQVIPIVREEVAKRDRERGVARRRLLTVATVAIVGAGPGGTSFLERLLASVPELLGDQPLDVHLVDPFPPGAGRIWRYEQSALLRMNSMAEDVTMFTDDSVRCEGPIRPGPSLIEWAEAVRGQPQATPELTAEVAALTATTFPTRQLQSAYLAWVFRSRGRRPPPGVASTSTGPGRWPSTTGRRRPGADRSTASPPSTPTWWCWPSVSWT